MYIYLDESYNLKDREKKQFISINGFLVLDERPLFKEWKRARKQFLIKKRRIHAKDTRFDNVRPWVKNLIARNDITVLSVFQVLQEITYEQYQKYWPKGKLAFDKVYYDLLKALMPELKLGEYKKVNIIIDSRKHKSGIVEQNKYEKELLEFIENTFPGTVFNFKSQMSTTDILLELADFISNILYRAYQEDDKEFFDKIVHKIIQLKNPLKNNGPFR